MAGALALATLAGCTSSSGDGPDPTVTTTSAPRVATSVAPTSAPATPGALPATCSELLALTELDAALGTGLPGSVTYVRGQPIPDIGRTDRITCGYGVTAPPSGAPQQPALLEVSVSSYTDAAAAQARVDVTTNDRAAEGDRVQEAAVGDLAAVALTGVTATTLVFADGTLTYSLTLQRAVVPDGQTVDRLSAVAEALRSTG